MLLVSMLCLWVIDVVGLFQSLLCIHFLKSHGFPKLYSHCFDNERFVSSLEKNST